MDGSSSGFNQRKAPKHMFEDCINQLPDDVLVSIISRLTLKEAAATSVISRRWRYLWTYVTVLDFDQSTLNLKCPNIELQRFIKLEPQACVDWVNSVVRSYQGLSLDKFKALVYPGIMSETEVSDLIHFAVTKGCEELVLDFATKYSRFSDDFYWCIDSNPNGISWIKPLKTLKLSQARVTDELLELVLSSCPQLTILEVSYSNGLRSLRIDHGTSLQLQHLGIYGCSLQNIEINSAPNLVSFAYKGLAIALRVENVPSLVRVSLEAIGRSTNLTFAFVALAKFLPQLEWLELKLWSIDFGYNLQFPHGELLKLKHLTLEVFIRTNDSLMGITRLMKASPSLEKFTLQSTSAGIDNLSRGTNTKTVRKDDAKCPHYNLKEVEFLRFSGQRAELELGQYLLANAVMLDTFVIRVSSDETDFNMSKWKRNALKRAKILEPGLHQKKIDFQIFE